MWEGRARSVRRELAALAAAGRGVAELHGAAIELVERIVPAELTCWASLDPDTAVISSMTSGRARIPGQYEPLLATYEYDGAEPHAFAQLARRSVPVARLSDLPRRERERSGRWTQVWRPLGLESELRVGFRADGVCWAAAGLVRRGEFSDREVEFLLSIGPTLAAATRVAALARGAAPAAEPAIVVVGPDGRRRGATDGVAAWESELDAIADGRFAVLLRAVATGAQAAASGTFRARVRDAHGGWIVLQASRLVAADDARDLVVTIRRASGGELLDVLLAAYRLTARERDVCREVLSGLSTSDIAARLGISANTVQDHLKSVFGKVGVRSRGELTARLSG
ncbi:helix-turn-helix transcriptional regulator [Amycolatopsis sp. Poz14]|uniref:helix-turn-helix transcriptional regulator n=1 Tax=Amycolatopsis sp. Poz14 TaxID=1447705 RepID=UPI001EE948AB|nr:helix-turn-helix transcriptional regulator [Amycolatopsis sp. Poz14]MCG3753423.1 helix-turn-helix transcriptional regulator [Amycolatopsis sp. Poz14]